MRSIVTFVALAVLVCSQRAVQATNLALGATVVNESSELDSRFPASSAVDGAGVTTPQLGVTATEGFGSGYWLSATGGQEFFILDLQTSSPIGQIRIANDTNGGNDDRNGLAFEVLGSNSLTSVSVTQLPATNTQDDNGMRLNNPVTLASGTLSQPTGGSNVTTFDVFNPSNFNLGSYRYIEYLQLTTLNSTATGPSYGGGLDELQIIGATVPEPSSFVLAGVAALGLLVVRRRRK